MRHRVEISVGSPSIYTRANCQNVPSHRKPELTSNYFLFFSAGFSVKSPSIRRECVTYSIPPLRYRIQGRDFYEENEPFNSGQLSKFAQFSIFLQPVSVSRWRHYWVYVCPKTEILLTGPVSGTPDPFELWWTCYEPSSPLIWNVPEVDISVGFSCASTRANGQIYPVLAFRDRAHLLPVFFSARPRR